MANVWRRGPITQNPYVRTAFRITRVSRETARRAAVVQRIGQTKRMVETIPGAHKIAGEPVVLADVIAAEQLLLDPAQRVPEELLHHAAEKPPTDYARRLAQQAADAMRAETGTNADESAVAAAAGIALARYVVGQFLGAGDGPDLAFGALELTIEPPFGREGA